MKDTKEIDHDNENPPVFNSWIKWYSFVLGFLVLQIIIYFFITAAFK